MYAYIFHTYMTYQKEMKCPQSYTCSFEFLFKFHSELEYVINIIIFVSNIHVGLENDFY